MSKYNVELEAYTWMEFVEAAAQRGILIDMDAMPGLIDLERGYLTVEQEGIRYGMFFDAKMTALFRSVLNSKIRADKWHRRWDKLRSLLHREK